MKTYVVTGAAGGIGLEVARQLRAAGERVIATARSEARCAEIRSALGDDVETVAIDLTSRPEILAGVERLREAAPVLDGLVNNAGVFETKHRLTAHGEETTWAVNVTAPYLLSEGLVDALEAAPAPRVVNLGSVMHKSGRLDLDDPHYTTRRFGGVASYGQSKLALLLMTREFARRHPRIDANCVHPGAIGTDVYRNAPAILRSLLARVLPPAAQGAAPVVRLLTDPLLTGTTGRYFDRMNERPASRLGGDDDLARRLYERLAVSTA